MKKIYLKLIIIISLMIPFYGLGEDKISIENLEPYKKLIPSDIKIEEIVEWSLSTKYRDKKVSLSVYIRDVKLTERELKTLKRRDEVAFKIYGSVRIQEPGRPPKYYYSRSLNVYIILTGENPKIVEKKRISLKKLCYT